VPVPGDQPAKHGRSLTGFYIALGVVAVLVGLGAWLWTPLRVLYWEREVRRTAPIPSENLVPGPRGFDPRFVGPRVQAARRLADIGPAAYASFNRLLNGSDDLLAIQVLSALGEPRDSWALPLIVHAASGKDAEKTPWAIGVAQNITDRKFYPARPDTGQPRPPPLTEEDVAQGQRNLLDWWEREGKAMYGEGQK
jgi:hypothetical protein